MKKFDPQPRKGKLRAYCPVYKPDDPRIQQDLRRGAGVGVDLSSLTEEEKIKWWEDRRKELVSGGVRTPVRDLVQEVNQMMRPDNERYLQDEDDDE